jgi:putative ABC transport system permease protein
MKVTTAALAETIAAVEETYKRLFPGNPFNYYFADAAFDEQYGADRRFATLFGAFAGIAIVIACLGLFGLASFTAERRTKEIGVRKVLGATVGSLVRLLSKEFMILVGIAFLIATPAAYVYMKGWLSDFAYHIPLGPGVFVLAGALALFIALVSVSYQAISVALADPVKSLRYE